MIRLLRRHFMASVLASAACSTTLVGAQPVGKVPRPKNGQPVAFIVAFEKYAPNNKDLVYPLDSAVELAKELSACGYSVTLVTGKSEMPEANAMRVAQDSPTDVAAATKLKNAGPVIQEANTAEDVKRHLDAWMAASFHGATRAPFGLVVVSGHGELREEKQYFLTPADRNGEGGVSIRGLQEMIGMLKVPIVLIVDSCRTETTAKKKDLNKEAVAENAAKPEAEFPRTFSMYTVGELVKDGRGNRLVMGNPKGDVGDKHAKWGPLTVCATGPMRPANDMRDDFLRSLALGLVDPDGAKGPAAFEARLNSTIPPEDLGRRVRDQDLSFWVWFRYAKDRIGNFTEDTQVIQIEPGFIDQTMVIAARDGVYEQLPPINLMTSWEGFANSDFEIDAHSSRSVVIRRPPGAGTNNLLANSFLDPVEVVNGMALMIEVVARTDRRLNEQGLQCLIVPGDNLLPPELSRFTTKQNQYSGLIQWNRPTTFIIRLDNVPQKGGTLRSMAISVDPQSIAQDSQKRGTWPEGASLTVTRMVLIGSNNNPIKPSINISSISSYDLMTRWWFSDVLRQKKEPKVTAVVDLGFEKKKSIAKAGLEQGTKHSRVFKLNVEQSEIGRAAGKGGPIYPEILLDGAPYRLEVVVKSFKPAAAGAKSAATFVLLEAKGKTIATAKIAVDDSKLGSKQYIDLDAGENLTVGGFADYLALVTDAAELELSSFALVPKKK